MSRDPIAHLQHMYADAVIRYDADQWGATWAPDARWELGAGRTVEGREAILNLWHSAMGNFHAVCQNVLNGTYELDEDAGTGTGRWYIIEHYHRRGDDGGTKAVCSPTTRTPTPASTASGFLRVGNWCRSTTVRPTCPAIS